MIDVSAGPMQSLTFRQLAKAGRLGHLYAASALDIARRCDEANGDEPELPEMVRIHGEYVALALAGAHTTLTST